MRLNWTGADWRTQGDLFIYLDTKEGGSVALYDPFPATQNKVGIFQPLDMAANKGLAADYMVWVRETDLTQTVTITHDDTTETVSQTGHVGATLMRWNSNLVKWVEVSKVWGYNFDYNSKQTDLYLPFTTLNITDPSIHSLGLFAVASEEDGLKLWATMPRHNNLNSNRVVDPFGNQGLELFIMLKQYEWSSLAPNMCPSGNIADVDPNQTVESVQYNGSEVEATLTADPVGLEYGLFSHNMIFGQTQAIAQATGNCADLPIFQDVPPPAAIFPFPLPEIGELKLLVSKGLCDRNGEFPAYINPRQVLGYLLGIAYPRVGDGQPINYTLKVVNHGSQASHGVTVIATAQGPLTLPAGQLDGQNYVYKQVIGTLAAGESQTVKIAGVVNLGFNPQEWTKLLVQVYDETGSASHPIEQINLDHQVDNSRPDYVEIQTADSVIGSGEQTLQGFVNDQSTVPMIMLDVNGQTTNCSDSTPGDSQWACQVNIGDLSDGTLVTTKVKAKDQYGFESDTFNGPTLVVDTTPPMLTLSSVTRNTFSNTLIRPKDVVLSGDMGDNRMVSRVEVCHDETCDPASLPQSSYVYEDAPSTPLVVGANNSCTAGTPIIRTFKVEDNFTIADLDVGLTIEHPFRNDVQVTLESPNGEQTQLVSGGTSRANFDILLNDVAGDISQAVDQSDHNMGSPYYENLRQPYPGNLHQFRGQSAQGRWTLSICDAFAASDDGLYQRSELRFQAAVLPANSQATWTYHLNLADKVENQAMSLQLYGYDSVGNRSEPIALNFTVDTKQPDLQVTQTSVVSATNLQGLEDLVGLDSPNPHLQGFENLAALASQQFNLAGTVSEVNTTTMHLVIRTPNHDFITERLPLVDNSWSYTDTNHFTHDGVYCLWVKAADKASNETIAGPYAVQATVTESSATLSNAVYLPILLNSYAVVTPSVNSQQTGLNRIYLPLMMKGPDGSSVPMPDEGSNRTVSLQFVDAAA